MCAKKMSFSVHALKKCWYEISRISVLLLPKQSAPSNILSQNQLELSDIKDALLITMLIHIAIAYEMMTLVIP